MRKLWAWLALWVLPADLDVMPVMLALGVWRHWHIRDGSYDVR